MSTHYLPENAPPATITRCDRLVADLTNDEGVTPILPNVTCPSCRTGAFADVAFTDVAIAAGVEQGARFAAFRHQTGELLLNRDPAALLAQVARTREPFVMVDIDGAGEPVDLSRRRWNGCVCTPAQRIENGEWEGPVLAVVEEFLAAVEGLGNLSDLPDDLRNDLRRAVEAAQHVEQTLDTDEGTPS